MMVGVAVVVVVGVVMLQKNDGEINNSMSWPPSDGQSLPSRTWKQSNVRIAKGRKTERERDIIMKEDKMAEAR